MTTALIFLAVFAAASVEMVEAVTILMAVGATREWREAWIGATAAVVVLGTAVTVGGLPLIRFVPVSLLRVGVGMMALYVGATWLKKAILRAAGRKAKHDEDVIYAETVASLRRSRRRGLVVAFNGVLVEGVEVVVIVTSMGVAQRRLGLAAVAALSAVAVVTVVAAILARQLSKVPENAIKMLVGVLVTSFGIFWLGEGLGLNWPAADASVVGVVGVVAAAAFAVVRLLKREEVLVER